MSIFQISTQNFYTGSTPVLNAQEQLLTQLESEMASGNAIQQVSDNPGVSSGVFSLEQSIANLNQYSSSNQAAQLWINSSITNLQNFSQVYQQVIQAGLQASNGTANLSALGSEVSNYIQSLMGSANATVDGLSLFSGSQTGTQAFTLSGSTLTYNGDSVARQEQLASGITVTTNVTGNTSLQPALAAAVQLEKDINAGNTAAIPADVAALQATQGGVQNSITGLGATLQLATTLSQQQQSLLSSYNAQISQDTGANMAALSAQYSSLLNGYKAAVQVTGAIDGLPTLAQYVS